MNYYVYARPNQMIGHTFTDDVAITRAKSKKEALENFRNLYTLSDEEARKYIFKLSTRFNNYGVAILTSY